jgi:hypothetical protein
VALRSYVRKKAVLVLYKLFLKFPKALRPSFPRLKEKLDDREVRVCASVYVRAHACACVSVCLVVRGCAGIDICIGICIYIYVYVYIHIHISCGAQVSVVSCAVNVVCELARKNPANFLSLAPIFFKLLTASSNNWYCGVLTLGYSRGTDSTMLALVYSRVLTVRCSGVRVFTVRLRRMLIKIVKLLGALTPLEPRLAKKMVLAGYSS